MGFDLFGRAIGDTPVVQAIAATPTTSSAPTTDPATARWRRVTGGELAVDGTSGTAACVAVATRRLWH